MKYSQLIGVAAAILLVVVCFLPWAYFPDIDKDFTGFFSERNAYGRPGKVFVFLCVIAILCYLIPRVWAKRVNMFVAAMTFAWAFKCFLQYGACYRGLCPDRKIALYFVLILPVVMIYAALSPSLQLKDKN